VVVFLVLVVMVGMITVAALTSQIWLQEYTFLLEHCLPRRAVSADPTDVIFLQALEKVVQNLCLVR
jgi:hypothetical protein